MVIGRSVVSKHFTCNMDAVETFLSQDTHFISLPGSAHFHSRVQFVAPVLLTIKGI